VRASEQESASRVLTRGLDRKLAGRKCTSASSSLPLWKKTSVGQRKGVSRSLLAMRQSARTLAYQSWSHQHCQSGITTVRFSTLRRGGTGQLSEQYLPEHCILFARHDLELVRTPLRLHD